MTTAALSLVSQETEDIVLDRGVVTEGVKAVLSDAGKGRYFIVEVDCSCGATGIVIKFRLVTA